ncbi:MAG: N-acetylmuramoyl-L-alanine amidase-like domain-containing protein [Bacteroidota bacterium]
MAQKITRRKFTRQAAYATIGSIVLKPLLFRPKNENSSDENTTLCIKKFSYAVDNKLYEKPIGEVVASIGLTFIGTVYQANVLDEGGEEHLVIHLQGLDCVTLCENALAFARCVELNTTTYEAYCRQLQYIRYRAGVIDKYPSRLHYFSDWIFDNEKKGVVKNVTADVGGHFSGKIVRKINFMTTHRALYKQLAENKFFVTIQHQEKEISRRRLRYIPKDNIDRISAKIRHGDILAFTTNIEGMDISHTGIAFRKEDGTIHLLHAPVPGTKVQITELSLHDYCAKNSRQTGIIIARPLEPVVH